MPVEEIFVLGINHKTAPIEVRERVALPASETRSLLCALKSSPGVLEVVALSTCNRFEIYCAGKGDCSETVRRLLVSFASGEIPGRCFYTLRGKDAVNHLFRVASSLDSLVVGETQILSQVKGAYLTAKESSTAGKYLSLLFQKALKVGKQVLTATDIAKKKVSVSSVAVDLVREIFPDLSEKVVLVIGSGKMGKLSVTHLVEAGVKRVLVANRTRARARKVAREVGGEIVPLEKLDYYLSVADIVIGCTSAPSAVLHREMCAPAIAARKGRTIFIIDLGVPRNVDPEVGKLDWVHLYNIDQLEEVVRRNMSQRRQDADRGLAIVSSESEKAVRQLETLEHDDLVVRLVERLENLRHEELERLAAKLPDLTQKERREIEYATQRVVKKILHKPLSLLKNSCANGEKQALAEAIETLFLDQ
jgi:glutamyl-tRNA reductase